MAIGDHTGLRHVGQTSMSGMFLEPLVLPEKCARHGGGDDQGVEQGSADERRHGNQQTGDQPDHQSSVTAGLAGGKGREGCQTQAQ